MEHLRILRDIEMKKLKPVYFLMGEEPYFIDLITDAVEDKILDESSKAFCQTIVYGRDVTMDQVVGLAKSFPMMGDRQVVVVKEAQDMNEWKKKSASEDDEDQEAAVTKKSGDKKNAEKPANHLKVLEAYLQNPTPSTILVFAYKGKVLDKRLKVAAKLKEIGEVFHSEKLKDHKVVSWISSYITQLGYKIDPGAAILLSEYLGTDLGKIVNEVGKLCITLAPGTTINSKHIEDNIGISKDYNVWELQKCIGQKNIEKANQIAYYFERNPKSNPIQMVIPSLYNFFVKLAIYQSLPDKSNAASTLGVAPYALNDFREAARNFIPRKVERIITSLRKADKQVKGIDSAAIPDGEILKELLFRILH